MYISRVKMASDNRQKMKDLTHVGAFHHWVEQSFPKEIMQKKRTRKLWRVDYLNQGQYLLVVSEDRPDLCMLEKYGVEGTAATKDYAHFLDDISFHMRARFRVALNPVVSVSQGEGVRGRVVPHVTVEQQMKFLLARSIMNGFLLQEDEFRIVERSYVNYYKKGQKSIRLSKVVYDGALTVQDKDLFVQTLTKGFGKKKSYGFGLMTIIPMG